MPTNLDECNPILTLVDSCADAYIHPVLLPSPIILPTEVGNLVTHETFDLRDIGESGRTR